MSTRPNIGSGWATTILELATKINALTSNEAGIRFAPLRGWDQVPHRMCDNERARRAFNFCGNDLIGRGP